MKTLHLLRHAKSSWSNPQHSDRERPLKKRGQRDAANMGRALQNVLDPLPMAVSPAQRAQLTLQGLCDEWTELERLNHPIVEELYTFSAKDLLDWLEVQSDAGDTLFLIGHNPALTDLANALAGGQVIDNIPTAGYVQLVLDIPQWKSIRPTCGRITQQLFPRDLN